jgi:hypothetical protein
MIVCRDSNGKKYLLDLPSASDRATRDGSSTHQAYLTRLWSFEEVWGGVVEDGANFKKYLQVGISATNTPARKQGVQGAEEPSNVPM